jgi:hypothetical protein
MEIINAALKAVSNRLVNIVEGTKEYEIILIKLKRLYLLECRINLKILSVAKNKNIELMYVLKLLNKLENESSKILYSEIDKSVLNHLFNKIVKKNDTDLIKKEELLVSIISKIELLKILALSFEDLESQSIIRIRARINNLYKQLRIVVETFNNDINNYN